MPSKQGSADHRLGRRGPPPKPAPPGLARRLRETREELGLSVAECATRIGVHRDTWYSWERGDTEPSLHDGLAAAKLLQVSVFWLGMGTGPR